MLPGISGPLMESSKIKVDFPGYSYLSGYNTTTATYTGMNCSHVGEDRILMCLLTWEAAAAISLSSALFRNTATSTDYPATILQTTNSTAGIALFTAVVPTGTAFNIPLTFSGNMNASAAFFFELKNYQSRVPCKYNTFIGSGTSVSGEMHVPEGGYGWCLTTTPSNVRHTLSGLTASYTTYMDVTTLAGYTMSSSLREYTATPIDGTVGTTYTDATGDEVMACLSWI